jgi:RNA-splicing ligase RtcB
MFNCGICGRTYGTIEERMNCEKKCYENKQKEDKNKQLEKLKQEKEVRISEVEKAYKNADEVYNKAVELENKYKKDYGMISGNCISGDDFEKEMNNILKRVFVF